MPVNMNLSQPEGRSKGFEQLNSVMAAIFSIPLLVLMSKARHVKLILLFNMKYDEKVSHPTLLRKEKEGKEHG